MFKTNWKRYALAALAAVKLACYPMPDAREADFTPSDNGDDRTPLGTEPPVPTNPPDGNGGNDTPTPRPPQATEVPEQTPNPNPGPTEPPPAPQQQDQDLDGWTIGQNDCDDTDANVHPNAEEVCNDEKDTDCDGSAAENETGCTTKTEDNDGDGYCEGTICSDTTKSGGDCDDGDASIHPHATEVCDRKDNDCDGDIDAADGQYAGNIYYYDSDNDTWGADSKTTNSCSMQAGYVDRSGDCNDNDGDVHPGATEFYNQVDDDCNGVADDSMWTESDFNEVGTCYMGEGEEQTPPWWWGGYLPTPTSSDPDPGFGINCRDGGRPLFNEYLIGRIEQTTCPAGKTPGSNGWDAAQNTFCFWLRGSL